MAKANPLHDDDSAKVLLREQNVLVFRYFSQPQEESHVLSNRESTSTIILLDRSLSSSNTSVFVAYTTIRLRSYSQIFRPSLDGTRTDVVLTVVTRPHMYLRCACAEYFCTDEYDPQPFRTHSS
jgi:hypothetical protein